MASPLSQLSQLVRLPHEPNLAQAVIGALDLAPGERLPWASSQPLPQSLARSVEGFGDQVVQQSYLALQYWPETLEDSRASEWSSRQVPGGSHPIYQWASGGERTISFSAVFTTDHAPDDLNVRNEDPYTNKLGVEGPGTRRGTRDIDIRAAIAWLRYFTYPYYDPSSGFSHEPPKVILVLPNTRIGYDGSDYVIAVMTQCDVTYEAWFPNGFPRIAEVQLQFSEVVQHGGSVRFHNRYLMSAAATAASYLRPK